MPSPIGMEMLPSAVSPDTFPENGGSIGSPFPVMGSGKEKLSPLILPLLSGSVPNCDSALPVSVSPACVSVMVMTSGPCGPSSVNSHLPVIFAGVLVSCPDIGDATSAASIAKTTALLLCIGLPSVKWFLELLPHAASSSQLLTARTLESRAHAVEDSHVNRSTRTETRDHSTWWNEHTVFQFALIADDVINRSAIDH